MKLRPLVEIEDNISKLGQVTSDVIRSGNMSTMEIHGILELILALTADMHDLTLHVIEQSET